MLCSFFHVIQMSNCAFAEWDELETSELWNVRDGMAFPINAFFFAIAFVESFLCLLDPLQSSCVYLYLHLILFSCDGISYRNQYSVSPSARAIACHPIKRGVSAYLCRTGPDWTGPDRI